MWAYREWEINTLWEIVDHKYGFLTAIWNQHIWLFWDQKKLIKAKSEIQNSIIKNNWILYINYDNKKISKIKFQKKLNIIKYWTSKECDAISEFKKISGSNFIFSFKYKNINETLSTNLLWEHNIINLTWVIVFCIDQWLKIEKLQKYLLNLKTPKNTLRIKEKKYWKIKVKIIDDTYNLSEDWLFAWLNLLKYFSKKYEKILIIDDILELWKNAKNIHYKIWKRIAKKWYIDKIIYVWVNYKTEFKKWLLDWKFKNDSILTSIKEIEKDTIFLLEWRNAKKFKILKKKNV